MTLDELESLRSIAVTGINFSNNPYDLERYRRLLAIVSQAYADLTNGLLDTATISQRFSQELGCITPKVGASVAVFDPGYKLLLVQRNDDLSWCLPCGWVEVNETPEQAAVREVKEETGLDVRISHLIRLGVRKPHEFGSPHSSIHLLYRGYVLGGVLNDSIETCRVGFYDASTIENWHLDHALEYQAAILDLAKDDAVL